jgi:hypothetical protein
MASRRQVLVSGAALSGVALLPLPAHGAVSELLAPGIELFVFDTRFDDAVALAQLAAEQGIPLAETSGDLMDLWYDNLDLRWKEAPMLLSGVTTAKTLFVLETLRVVQRKGQGQGELTDTQLVPIGDTQLVSWIIAPRGLAF